MASHVVVIASNLRRTTIKVTPRTYLVDVLQEACKKLGLDSDKYLVRHKQKQVDLSVPFRTSGLLPGAKLELVQKANTPSAVQIALQLPQPDAKDVPGGRLIRRFPSDLTLWKMLRQFESGEASGGRNINMTARGVAGGSGSGQLYYETPVLNIMGRELASFADFQRTLSQLGHNSGNVLIRLSYRRTEQTLFETMAQISHFFNEAEGHDAKADVSMADSSIPDENKAPEPPQDTATADAAPRQPPHDPPAEAQQPPPAQDQPAAPAAAGQAPPEAAAPKTTEPCASQDPYQPVSVFLAPAGSTPAAALAPADEADFTPTVAHAQLHQARLQQSSRNKRLPSDKELEAKAAAEQARVAAVHSVLVKVRFPDNTSSDWRVGPADTGAFLYEAVRRVMARPELPFRLVLPGSKTAICDDAGPRHGLVGAYRLSGRVLVSLVWDDGVPADARAQPFLRPGVAQRGQAVRVPALAAPDVAADDDDDGGGAPDPRKHPPAADDDKAEGEGRGGVKKVPRWLKLGRK